MNLIELFNKLTKRQTGTFILCDKHLAEFKEMHAPGIFSFRELKKGFEGECQMCAEGDTTPIQFEKTPENIDLFVTFADDRGEGGWSASGRIGELDYVMDNEGRIFNTEESLYRHGVRKMYVETGFEIHLDLDL